MKELLLLTQVLLAICFTQAANIRRKATSLTPKHANNSLGYRSHNRRGLAAITGNFVALSCNKVIAPCVSWVATFGPQTVQTNRTTIPCGTCVTMDVTGEKLTLQGGLDIKGKLVFPDGYKLIVETNMIAVQGILEITSTKPVDGSPAITFNMVGNSDQSFTPHPENQNVCGGTNCPTGNKAIVVAGGKVTLSGLPANTPTWTRLYDVAGTDLTNPDTIVVPDVVRGKWAKGADILITSHTLNWYDQQQATIVDVVNSTKAGYVNLVLNAAIVRPVTTKDSIDFAVEVALLSRNILFLGPDDLVNFQGGHMWVLNTPSVTQTIEGVEFRNFGQQGKLFRYPINFHTCGNVTGSVVRKNTIRKSNQRCIVVQGTNNLRIEENIAYDTKGHCFMLEDGIEIGNQFVRNLGARTAKPNIIIPNMGTNGVETDLSVPSTFLISNPTNSFEGNVAAGSAGSGFWFELKKRGDLASLYPNLDPRLEPLTQFKDNIAHGNRLRGVHTYPTGYTPQIPASFVGLKAYKNVLNGLLIHNSNYITIDGGIFADNKYLGVGITKAESINLEGSQIIGESDHYTKLRTTQKLQSLCVNNALVGIELQTYNTLLNNSGIFSDSVDFSGFSTKTCGKSLAFRFDKSTRLDMFEQPVTFKNITLEQRTDVADFCWSKGNGVIDGYIIDLNGAMSPSGVPTGSPASLVSNKLYMQNFIDTTKCTQVATRCYSYCQDTCIRAARFEIESYGTENYTLNVCRKASGSNCTKFLSHDGTGDETLDVARSTSIRMFTANFPPGQYNATILDSTGNQVWPTFVRVVLDQTYCPNTLGEGDITITKLPVADVDATCAQLIRNGNVEASQADPPLYWYHRWGGVQIAKGQGVGGSNAVTNIQDENGPSDAIGQFLDTRCLAATQGRNYEFSARVKLVNASDNSIYKCDPLAESCPSVGITNSGWTRENVASIIEERNEGDFQLIHGLIHVDADIASASSLFLYVEKGRTDLELFVDDVSLTLMPNEISASSECTNMVYNSDFQSGDSRFWIDDTAISVEVVAVNGSSASFALKMAGGALLPELKSGCFEAKLGYEVTVHYQLTGPSGNIITCNPTSTNITKMCPQVQLLSYQNNVRRDLLTVARSPNTTTVNGWSLLTGSFTATTTMAASDRMELQFTNLISNSALVVKDVSVTLSPSQKADVTAEQVVNCDDNLILNSDMEAGFDGYWVPGGSGEFRMATGVNSTKAIRYMNRSSKYDGPKYAAQQLMDFTCLTAGSTFEFNADIKLFNASDGALVSCDPSSNCPKIRVVIQDSDDNLAMKSVLKGYDLPGGTWQSGKFNHFRKSFTLPGNSTWDGTINILKIQVRNFPKQWNIVLDNFTLKKVK